MITFRAIAFSATIAMLIGTDVRAQGPALPELPNEASLSARAGFEPNKGQVVTTVGDPAPFVRYRLSQGNTHIFLLEDGIAYQFGRPHRPEGSQPLLHRSRPPMRALGQQGDPRERAGLETYRMDMVLEGAAMQPLITAEGWSSDHINYYTHDALNVRRCDKVTYHDVYPGIDWVIYTTTQGMKYDFVVRPGADPARIQLRFEHQEELFLDDNGGLVHGNRLGRFREQAPVSYQDGSDVPTRFVLDGSILRFAIGEYDRNRTLTIDPARVWGTYYGGTEWDDANTCAVDGSGNVHLAGTTYSTGAIAAAGFQSTNAGGSDAYLVKFDPSGLRSWASYYGGTMDDNGFGCAVDGVGNVYLTGSTGSSSAIAFGGHQNTLGGSEDAFLVKFDPSGARLWATYYGGPDYDGMGSCAVDASGHVYAAGATSSTSAIASGGHQNVGGGLDDAFLVKFDPNGVRQWSTYYGGAAMDGATCCALDPGGNVYMGGTTSSTASIASGGHQNTYGGDVYDAFLVKFNSNGVRQWGTYCGGSGSEGGNGCAVDGSGNAYLIGTTTSLTTLASGGYQDTYGGGPSDAYLVKYNASGVKQWGTYYGGSIEDYGTSCALDGSGNVYLAGATNSLSGIASGGHQNTYGGGSVDGYLVKMDPNGVRSWGTYYGGGLDDAGNSCSVFGGHVYLAGTCRSTSAIASSGHQNVYGGGAVDAFLVKFSDSTTPCTENLTLEFATDANGSETSWEIVQVGTSTVVASGPSTPFADNATIVENICLPIGCYQLRVFDAGGDGIPGGGYVLRNAGGHRIIDSSNNGDFATVSQVSGTLGFCLPIGTQALTLGTTDREDLLVTDQVIAHPDAGVSAEYPVSSNGDLTDDGYQFWIFDPHGTYSRRILFSHASSGTGGGVGATRACHLRLNFTTLPVPLTVLLNVRVRPRVNGVNNEWGPASRLRVLPYPPPCPTTRLVDTPGSPNYSCGVSRVFGGSDKVVAFAVSGADLYQFEFEQAAEGYVRRIASGSSALLLNWFTNQPLCGTYAYLVRVRTSFDAGATWCAFGADCTVTITNSESGCSPSAAFAGNGTRAMGSLEDAGVLMVHPNPTRDGRLTLQLEGLAVNETQVRSEVYDMRGALLVEQVLSCNNGALRQVLQLPTGLRSGTYLLVLHTDTRAYQKRVVVE